MVLGIVAEYNPFHNGHKYQIDQAKKKSGADLVVVVMSGSFVQRGDAAICSKWARARMALLNGVDLVAELPVHIAVQSAGYFAKGAIELLNSLNVDLVSFGAETDNITDLTALAKTLDIQPAEYKTALTDALKRGASFPKARDIALGHQGALLRQPNNILGVEYIRAGAKNPLPIKRFGCSHDSMDGYAGFASASQIRALLLEGKYSESAEFMPPAAFKILMEEIDHGCAPVSIEGLETTIIANLRKEQPTALGLISDVSEGLENRIIRMARSNSNLSALADAVKNKRYTHSRIRRILINYLLGIQKNRQGEPPAYIRVLGGNKKGFNLLNSANLPVVTKVTSENTHPCDIYSTDVYSLLYNNAKYRYAGCDFLTSPISDTR